MAAPIKPILAKWDPIEQSWIWGLDEETFNRVQSGYGCVKCLEPFDYHVKVCYVCGHPNTVAVAPLPPEWVGR